MMRLELAPVRSFVDWAEAWAVCAGVLSNHDPKRVKNLIGYFLLLATAFREVTGLGWLDYDKAFRKLAEDDTNAKRGEASPTLWVTKVNTRSSAQGVGTKDLPASQQGTKDVQYCHRWNNGFCPNTLKCRYAYQCNSCKGKHPRVYCTPSLVGGPHQANHYQENERANSPPPKKKYKHWLSLEGQRTGNFEILPSPNSYSPFNLNVWKIFLFKSDYEDAQYVLDGIYNGFSLGVSQGEISSAKRNCVSAYEKSDIIEKYIAEELKAGAIAGPFQEPPVPGMHINRFGVILKSTPGKCCWIIDLSFPIGKSVNDLIPDCNSALTNIWRYTGSDFYHYENGKRCFHFLFFHFQSITEGDPSTNWLIYKGPSI